jgi:exodeoxyribonuclease VIII
MFETDVDELMDLALNNRLTVINEEVESANKNPFMGKVKSFDYADSLLNEDYQKIKGISSSMLKEAKTPTHLLRYLTKEWVKKDAFEIGTAFHTMFLEPQRFEYVLFDDSVICEQIGGTNPRATSKYKTWKSEFIEHHSGSSILDKDAFKVMYSASKRVESFPVIKSLVEYGKIERSYFIELNDGLKLKVRPDCLTQLNKRLVDLLGFGKENDFLNLSVKTSKDASQEGFRREFYKYGYHMSESFYKDILEAGTGENVHTIILAVEPETGLFMLHHITDDTMLAGRISYLKNLNVCRGFNFDKYDSKQILPGYEFEGELINEI